jgi:hypothetical protein
MMSAKINWNIDDSVKSAMKRFKGGRNAAILGVTAAGIAGVADVAMNAEEKHRSKEQQRAQHQKQVNRDKRSKKYDYAGTEYQPDAFGDVVLEMFNQRTGHYKMGNAKFKANPIL